MKSNYQKHFEESAVKTSLHLKTTHRIKYNRYYQWLGDISTGKVKYSEKYQKIVDGLLKTKPS